MEVCGIEEAIEVCKELIAENSNDLLNCWDSGEEAKQAIETVLKELKNKDLYINMATEIIKNSISKEKIKDKIEEEKIPLTIVGGRKNKKTLEYGIKLGRRHVLQELLEGRKEK